ncbi:alpha/beta fold hydrolase [Flavimobilis soli]|uniref:alpha/beta fold hydrolase n=1 Tax=Flavimobilis soli TaxID=442709 RepID=UPI001CA4B1EE|nr:alpha/beta fold hydrolase [Flavimobilis soli]
MKHVEVGLDGARTGYVEIAGEGTPLVLLHGLGAASAPYYAATVASPALAGRHAFLVDLLGFGTSDRPTSFSYSLADQADAVARALAALGLSAVDLVAHSMSGGIAVSSLTAGPTSPGGWCSSSRAWNRRRVPAWTGSPRRSSSAAA